MATSIGSSPLLGPRLQAVLESRRWETAEGVAIGVVVGGLLTFVLQHVLQIQRATLRGQVLMVCPPDQTPRPVPGGTVDVVGTVGPGGGGVFETGIGADGGFSVSVPPGLYVLAVRLPSGQQVPPMVVTPQTQSGALAIPSALELIGDVWGQVLVPSSGGVTVNLVVNC